MLKITGFLVLATALLCSHSAGAEPFKAGLARIKVTNQTPFDVLVAYPTDSAEAEINESSYTVRATENAPVVSGTRFPIVLFAKGNGREAGSPLVHHDMILRLAREGFVVVAPFFPASTRPFVSRPRQMREAFDAAI